jgi:hypothetical protein
MNSDWSDNRQHESRTYVFKILNTTNTVCGEKCESFSWVQGKFINQEK